jgi:hypothetical protein
MIDSIALAAYVLVGAPVTLYIAHTNRYQNRLRDIRIWLGAKPSLKEVHLLTHLLVWAAKKTGIGLGMIYYLHWLLSGSEVMTSGIRRPVPQLRR